MLEILVLQKIFCTIGKWWTCIKLDVYGLLSLSALFQRLISATLHETEFPDIVQQQDPCS